VAFPAVYYTFLGKEKGPKAGYLFSYLDKDFVLNRLSEVI
jgi:lysyl-tRNA synthetase class 1